MLNLRWPFEYKIIPVASNGKFGRYGYYDKLAGFPHQGSDYRIPCNTKWYWPVSGKIDLFEKRNYGYGYYSRVKFNKGYLGFAHNNALAGYKGKKVKAGDYGGKVGSTGLGQGCHVHIELRNSQGVVVDPDKNIKWKEVGDVTDFDACVLAFRGITNKFPTAANKAVFTSWLKKGHSVPDIVRNTIYLNTLEKRLAPYKKQIADLTAKVVKLEKDVAVAIEKTSTDYQKVIDKLSSDLTQKDSVIFGLQEDYTNARMETTARNDELQMCLKDLKVAQTPAESLDKPAIPRVRTTDSFLVRIWKRIIQFIAK